MSACGGVAQPGRDRSVVGTLTRPHVDDVTEMSELLRVAEVPAARNISRTKTRYVVARPVHPFRPVVPAVLLLALVTTPACVVPPPLELDQPDAGPNAPPIITGANDSAGNPLRPPGTVTVNRADLGGRLSFRLYDVDTDDTLYVRLYVDYDLTAPLPARSDCFAPPPADATQERTASDCELAILCNPGDVGLPHRLEADVSDRPLAQPTANHRDVEAPGLQSTWTWDLECIDQSL